MINSCFSSYDKADTTPYIQLAVLWIPDKENPAQLVVSTTNKMRLYFLDRTLSLDNLKEINYIGTTQSGY